MPVAYSSRAINLLVQRATAAQLQNVDRFIPNGWTQWNYSRALNSYRSSQPYFGRLLYPRHSAKAQGGDITVGGWREKAAALVSKSWCRPTCINTHTCISIFFLLLDEGHFIGILEETENKLQKQFPLGKKTNLDIVCPGIQITHRPSSQRAIQGLIPSAKWNRNISRP